jgi:fatty-acid desaturase
MELGHVARLEDFGKRSLITHAIMALSFAGAITAGLFIGGELGLVSFVALLNFTAGVWVAQSIHSLGHGSGGGEYDGILNEIVDLTDTSDSSGLDTGRLARMFTLIAAVTAVSLLTSAQVLSGALLSIAVVAVGSIALVTAITGFLISLGASYDESMRQWTAKVERQQGLETSEQK